MSSRLLTRRFICREHRGQAVDALSPALSWNHVMALTNDLGTVGRAVRSVVYGTRGCADTWRHREAIRADHALGAALLLALRTGCDSRDIAALKKCGGGELELLRRIVPRARRAEYRDWNNCAVGAAHVNDKLLCGRRLREAEIEVPTQFPITAAARIRLEAPPSGLSFSHPSIAPGTQWMLKDRNGMQGESIWRAVARAESGAPGATGGPHGGGPPGSALVTTVADLARRGRLMAEELLPCEEWFGRAGDSALPTVRVVTSKLSGPTRVIGLVLFRGGPGAVAANRRQGGTAHLVSEAGTCLRGIDRDGNPGGPCAYRFTGSRLSRLRAMCIEAHELFPCVGSVGWDVGLSARGPFLLEGNANWGMNVPQLMPGTPMLAEFRRSRFRTGRFAGRP